MSYGSSYSPSNPNITYSIDGIRVSANNFMNFAEMALQDPLRVMEYFARSVKPDIHIKWHRGIPDLTLLPQNTGPLSTDETDSLLADLQKNQFIKSTLEKLKANTNRSQHGTTDILELFDAVKKGRGFDWRSMSSEATGGGGPGVASMRINPTRQWTLKGAVGRGGTLIHELLHVAGYGHDVIAKAMYDVGGKFDKSWKAWKGNFPDPEGRSVILRER